MTSRSNQSDAQADLAASAGLLERLLRGQLDGHQRLLECIARKRDAIARADIDAVTRICQEENVIIGKFTDLEKHRIQLMSRMTQSIDAGARKSLTVSELAAHFAEPSQTRVLAIAAQLRDVLLEVKQQSSIIRAAADALSRHMTGIVQTVHSALNRARVYSPRGNVAHGPALPSIVDLKS
jgi:hypothetical protein